MSWPAWEGYRICLTHVVGALREKASASSVLDEYDCTALLCVSNGKWLPTPLHYIPFVDSKWSRKARSLGVLGTLHKAFRPRLPGGPPGLWRLDSLT